MPEVRVPQPDSPGMDLRRRARIGRTSPYVRSQPVEAPSAAAARRGEQKEHEAVRHGQLAA
jgi:hypothetical protein